MTEKSKNYGVWARWFIGILLGGGGLIGIMQFLEDRNIRKEESRKEIQRQQKEQTEAMIAQFQKDLSDWNIFSPPAISKNYSTLRGLDAIDLELGNISSNLNQSNSWDLRFICGPNGMEGLRAMNGCQWKEIGVQEFNDISYKTILESDFSTRRNSASGNTDLFYLHKSNVPGPKYTYFIKTADGNIGKVQIQAYQAVDPNPMVCRNIKLQYELFPVVNYPPKPEAPK